VGGDTTAALTLVVLGALLLSSGTSADEVLALEALRNAEYASSWAPSGRVRLRDGHFREPAAPGSATEVRVWLLDQVVRWTVDGQPYAAVILATEPGGSGTFYELVVVEARARRPVQVASAELGDRVRVQSLTVERGTGPPAIRATLLVHGPDDPLCCPTRLAVRSFVWRDGALVPPE
jgi:hypothetical protein